MDFKKRLEAGNVQFTFLNSGDIFHVSHKTTMINQLMTDPINGSLNNLYLRLYYPTGIKAIPLLGVHSSSHVEFLDSKVIWTGSVDEVHYQVIFTLTKQGIWFWDVTLKGNDVEADIIYGQDLGLADQGAVRSNEAYMSQYMDHAVFNDEKRGYIVCTRQNQPQSGGTFPYIQQGSLQKSIGYSTDGFQFFGLSYKETNEPEILTKNTLANEVYQYEFAYIALQSEKVTLSGTHQFVFYGVFKENHSSAITSLEFEAELLQAWEQAKMSETSIGQPAPKVVISSSIGEPLQTISMTKEEVDQYFPIRYQEEWDSNTLLSFFTNTYEHVVLKEKELLVERPHGHILMSGQNDKVKDDTMTTTSYMYGVFNSHIVIGNTSMNKMMTNMRNALNNTKTSGQRIYVDINGSYQLLTMPSMFEIGFNYVRWYYKTSEDLLMITNYTTLDRPEIRLQVRSASGKEYRYLVTNQITMNNNEYEVPFRYEARNNEITFFADSSSDSAKTYPDLTYKLYLTGSKMTVSDEEKIASNVEPGSASLVVLEVAPTKEWTITIQGLLNGEDITLVELDPAYEIERYRTYYRQVMNGFHLSMQGESSEELEKVNALAWWYTHNMLVHFSVPHGLEQYGGAAWGTRDVCQGPTEYFMATQNYDTVRDIIKIVYSHQYQDDGNWPQWFMFDKYFKFQQDDSHGDIIVWPLKVISDYLDVTRDFSILDEEVPYTVRGSFDFTENKATLRDHINKEIQYIKNNFLHDTYLSSYGDGDWDDTLQPANPQLKKYMASSWTVALTYQAITKLSKVLSDVNETESEKLMTLANGIKEDYNKYILQTDVIPGFVYMEDPNNPELMVHPSDTKTGINYRLLPMQRGIISELLTPEQANAHYQIIKDKLYCPDGVRLMDRPAQYKGGVSTNFKRAEQASNFGREIGLQYVHAHIRYVEAMAKLGYIDEVWNGLEIINPVGIQNVVPNAERRQSNAYFSSSDGKFNTRYEAQKRFNELREGTVKVKGGWRIYSSGPGIYMNQLISNCLGIRYEARNLIIDPVLPQKLNGLTLNFEMMGQQVIITYHLEQKEKSILINGKKIDTETTKNPYRQGGFLITKETIEQLFKSRDNEIEVYL
ncbi:cellobiose phosphorylase [Bacillus sp. REN16]|uniref:cellobiose phosphorylase n=1 Tax=Bacillus sp. REN16 TaxID=2887296 RepID=UPI001E5F51AE|nr:cellobiose phosphorylase [Bacillus sp. REN16]MCC3358494.1 cellobiose phosphorylase [Bacillus sp. REN16]